MATSVGLAMNPPHATEERAVFTQLKPVRMSGAEGAEDTSVFEDVKPAVRISPNPLSAAGLQESRRSGLPESLKVFTAFRRGWEPRAALGNT